MSVHRPSCGVITQGAHVTLDCTHGSIESKTGEVMMPLHSGLTTAHMKVYVLLYIHHLEEMLRN